MIKIAFTGRLPLFWKTSQLFNTVTYDHIYNLDFLLYYCVHDRWQLSIVYYLMDILTKLTQLHNYTIPYKVTHIEIIEPLYMAMDINYDSHIFLYLSIFLSMNKPIYQVLKSYLGLCNMCLSHFVILRLGIGVPHWSNRQDTGE